MKSWQIFWQSVLRVTNNFGAAIRVSLVPYAITAVAVVALIAQFFSAMMQASNDQAAMQQLFMSDVPWAQMLIVAIVSVVCGIWTAVAWHRAILLDEVPGWLPPLKADRIFAYFLRALLIVIILIVATLVIGFVVALLAGMMVAGVAANSTGMAFVIGLVMALLIYVPILVLGFRLAAALPGAAIDNGAGIGAAWNATKGNIGMFLMLAIIIFAATIVASLIGGLLMGISPILSMVWQLASGWFSAMVGLSVLTTLYGHYVEGRSL